jgi:hypothetical protein
VKEKIWSLGRGCFSSIFDPAELIDKSGVQLLFMNGVHQQRPTRIGSHTEFQSISMIATGTTKLIAVRTDQRLDEVDIVGTA